MWRLLVFVAGCSSLLDLEPPPAAAPAWSFEDDFETGDLSRWTSPTPAHSPNGTIEVASAGAYAGCCALHVAATLPDSSSQYASERWTEASPPAPIFTAGTIAVRAYVRATALDPDTRELSIAQNGSNPPVFASAGLGITDQHDGSSWGFILSDGSTASYPLQSAMAVGDAIGGWHCVEYDVAVADAGHLAIYMDGALQIAGDANTRAQWDTVTIGLGFSSGVAASDVYIDNVAIALYADTSPTMHLGCE